MYLHNGVWLKGVSGALEFSIEQHVDASLMFTTLLKHGFSLFEGHELASLSGLFQFLPIQCLVKLRLADDLPHNVSLHNVLEIIPQTSFDILATHRDDNASSLS